MSLFRYYADFKKDDGSKIGMASLMWFLVVVFLGITVDVIWGLYDEKLLTGNRGFMAISVLTSSFYAFEIYIWYTFTVMFTRKSLGKKRTKPVKILTLIPALLCVLISLSTPVTNAFCRFDEKGGYFAGPMRAAYFICEYCYFILIIAWLIYMRVKNKSIRQGRDFFSAFNGAFPVIVCGIMQYENPDFPYYAVGLTASAVILFFSNLMSIEEDKLAAASLNYKNASAEIYSALEAIGDTFVSLHLIDMQTKKFEAIKSNPVLDAAMSSASDANAALKLTMNEVSNRSCAKDIIEFVELDALSERMQGKKRIYKEFLGVNAGWCISMFIRVESDKYGNLTKVLHAVQVINNYKREENLQNQTANKEIIVRNGMLSELVKLSSCGLISIDSDYNVITSNNAAAVMMGFKDCLSTPDRLRDFLVRARFDDEKAAVKLLHDAVDLGIPYFIDFDVYYDDGSIKRVHADVRRVKLTNDVNGFVGALTYCS